MFGKSKKLWELDPKDLDLETLSTLHTALIAKLVIVNQEFRGRLEAFAALSGELPNNQQDRQLFDKKAKELRGFDLILRQLIADAVKQPKG